MDKIDTFVLLNNKFFEAHKIDKIRSDLAKLNNSEWEDLLSIEFKDPIIVLIVSFLVGTLGIDRFMIGSIGIGLGKLLTFGGFGVWAVVDWFFIQKATKRSNLQKFNELFS